MLKVFIVALVIFKRLNSGAAKNGAEDVLVVRRHLLELELIQSHMAQKPVLRGEVGCACVAREVSVVICQRRGPRNACP